jgi:hypothetical protein
MMASLGPTLAQQNEEEIRRQLEETAIEQGVGTGEGAEEWERSMKEIQVRGEPVAFNFATGKSPGTETERIEVTGIFQGQSGPVMLILSADTQVIDEEAVVKMIESIK